MNIKTTLITVLLILAVVLAINLYANPFREKAIDPGVVASFGGCVAAGNPIMESFPRQCRTKDGKVFEEMVDLPPAVASKSTVDPRLSPVEARTIAEGNETCTLEGTIGTFETYEPRSGTWWFSLNADRTSCNPGCAVDDQTSTATIDWRCSAL